MLDELDLDEKTKSTLLTNIKRRLTPQAVKVRADVEVSCYAYDGIDAVKNSLLEGLKCSSEDVPIKVCYDQLFIVSLWYFHIMSNWLLLKTIVVSPLFILIHGFLSHTFFFGRNETQNFKLEASNLFLFCSETSKVVILHNGVILRQFQASY